MKPEYFIQEVNPNWPEEGEELGPITFRQEIFCWVYALTGNGMKANRHAYGHRTGNGQNSYACKMLRRPAIRVRIEQLRKADAEGGVNFFSGKIVRLTDGPWDHYNRHDEGNKIDPGTVSVEQVRQRVWNDKGEPTDKVITRETHKPDPNQIYWGGRCMKDPAQ